MVSFNGSMNISCFYPNRLRLAATDPAGALVNFESDGCEKSARGPLVASLAIGLYSQRADTLPEESVNAVTLPLVFRSVAPGADLKCPCPGELTIQITAAAAATSKSVYHFISGRLSFASRRAVASVQLKTMGTSIRVI